MTNDLPIITDWKSENTEVPGSLLNVDVYYACYSLSIGAADALAAVDPSYQVTCNTIEKYFRRFAVQYRLSTAHEVYMHSAEIIGWAVAEVKRERGNVFVPPF